MNNEDRVRVVIKLKKNAGTFTRDMLTDLGVEIRQSKNGIIEGTIDNSRVHDILGTPEVKGVRVIHRDYR